MSTPYKRRGLDSPSRQLLWELNQMAVSSQEGFYAHLDRENEEREDLHRQALATAARKHERVRKIAEIEKRRLEEEQEAKQERLEEEQHKALEVQRHENELAEQRREQEKARAAERHERELAEAQRFKDDMQERQRLEKQRLEAERERKQKEEAEIKSQKNARIAEAAKAREDATAAAKAKSLTALVSSTAPVKLASQPSPQAVATRPAATQSAATQSASDPRRELEHDRYLQIHQRLKVLRKFMTKTAKEHSQLKAEMGNMRRNIKKSVGQLNKSAGGNKKPLRTIIETLHKALTLTEPKVNMLDFLAHTPSDPPTDPTSPALPVYLLNTFSKDIVAQFIDEAGVNPTAADQVGIIASHIFALHPFRWQGISLIDILLAKMHVVAPALFGIYGPETTAAGKTRLGWRRDADDDSSGAFIDQQQHFSRMTGLAAGFAALTLRNYEKAKVINPLPENNYWLALARLTHAPAASITQTHFILLKGLIQHYETKFIGFYGGAAIAALREAIIDLPARCPPSVASKALAGLKEVLAREKKLVL